MGTQACVPGSNKEDTRYWLATSQSLVGHQPIHFIISHFPKLFPILRLWLLLREGSSNRVLYNLCVRGSKSIEQII
jgi:hypothetical protein